MVQWVDGNQNIQIRDVSDSLIQIYLKDSGRFWNVPLEPATVPASPEVASPARLVKARSGVVPYVDRSGNLAHLADWIAAPGPFSVYVIGGRGGSGKTRLAVEACERTRTEASWLSGLLPRDASASGLADLCATPNPRLVVIDYAETRLEQLEVVLPQLQRAATDSYPVRVVLLVRAPPRQSDEWMEALQGGSDYLDALLDGAKVRVIDDSNPTLEECSDLFHAAAGAFARRTRAATDLVNLQEPDFSHTGFSDPLLIVVSAYLAVHDGEELPSTRRALMSGLLRHEDKYWSGSAKGLNLSRVLRTRVVALATLTLAENEQEAASTLQALPDLTDSSAERRHELARWMHSLYPGQRWWNPLEPDLLGEHLISTALAEFPEVFGATLDRERPGGLIRPLETLARVAAGDAKFAGLLEPIVSERLERLCQTAVKSSGSGPDGSILSDGTTVARALDQLVAVLPLESSALSAAFETLPLQPNVHLNGLALTLARLLVSRRRDEAAETGVDREASLAGSLYELAIRLFETGRRREAVAAALECVGIYRELVGNGSDAELTGLARALDLLSNCTAAEHRLAEAIELCAESVSIYRRLKQLEPCVHDRDLVIALNNLSNHLADSVRYPEALAILREAVTLSRGLVVLDERTYRPNLAMVLGNLSTCLAESGHRVDALPPINESVSIYRALAEEDMATYAPDLAIALNNLSNRLAEAGRRNDAFDPARDSATIFRQLNEVSEGAYSYQLAGTLLNLARRCSSTGKRAAALVAAKEAVTIFRELADNSPELFQGHVDSAAKLLSALSGR